MKEIMVVKICAFPLKVSAFLFAVIFICCFWLLRSSHPDFYLNLIREDGVVESLTAVFYLFSAIGSVIISISFVKNNMILYGLAYAFLGCAMFFIFGEEISWGQRILSIASPEFFMEHSKQKEINLHNLAPVQGITERMYILIGVYGSCLWPSLRLEKKNLLVSPYVIPGWYLVSYFFTVGFYYFYRYYIMSYSHFLNLTWREQEPAELILSMGFFLFILINRYRQIQDLNLPGSKCLQIKCI